MKFNFLRITAVCFIFTFLYSCTPQKNYIYLQQKDGNQDIVNQSNKQFAYKIKPKDVLYIKTVPIDEESALSISSNSQSNQYSTELGAYLNSFSVNDSGYIELPLVGKIRVEGLNIDEIQQVIQKKVDFYLKNSLVVVKLLSFDITILGEVNRPGTFKVYNTELNLLEALGMAGDLTMNGNRNQVVLVRQNQQKELIKLDLTDKNILQSEYFYLLPNDIIYVKPNKSKFFGTNPFPFATVLSSITTLILVLNFINK